MSRKLKVFLHTKVPQVAFDLLKEKFEVIVNHELPDFKGDQVIAQLNEINGVDGILWSSKCRVNNAILDAAGPNLKIVAAMSAGVDNLDIDDIKARGILISNSPNVLNSSVAEIAILLALAAGRRMLEGRQQIFEDKWTFHPQWLLGQGLDGATVGIVGLGGIGFTIAKRLKIFEVSEILYTGHNPKPAADSVGAKFVSMDTLLAQSDFVIVVCPLTPKTNQMFNEDLFNKMKKTAVFVNVSRGGIVDQEALIRALKNNTIFAAGLDVMTPEPLPSNHELLRLPNCVVIPHLGSATIKTRNAMATLAAKNVIAALNGESLLTPV